MKNVWSLRCAQAGRTLEALEAMRAKGEAVPKWKAYTADMGIETVGRCVRVLVSVRVRVRTHAHAHARSLSTCEHHTHTHTHTHIPAI